MMHDPHGMRPEGTRCPECNEDTIDHDPPFAECYNCGWQGQARELVVPRGDD